MANEAARKALVAILHIFANVMGAGGGMGVMEDGMLSLYTYTPRARAHTSNGKIDAISTTNHAEHMYRYAMRFHS